MNTQTMNREMDYARLLEIFQNYVSNDYEASEADYVYDALLEAGLEEDEFEELGFGWLLDMVSDDDDDE